MNPRTKPGSSQDQPDKRVYVYVPFSCLRKGSTEVSWEPSLANSTSSYRSLLGPSEVSQAVSPNSGVFEGVSYGSFQECPKSVPGVSKRCPRHSGHCLDTPEPSARRAPETPRHGGTLPRTPLFSGTLSGTLPGTLWARRARESPAAGRGVRKPS